MALALLFQDSSVMYLDAVKTYGKKRSSNVSNHPIDSTYAHITDHISKDNLTLHIKAVVSSADFHSPETRSPSLLTQLDSEYNRPADTATINSPSQLLDYLPQPIQSVLGGAGLSSVTSSDFRGYSHEVARERLERAWDQSELISIIDEDWDIATGRTVSSKLIENCLIENYDDIEDADTGDALSVTLTLSQVRFAYLKEVDVQISQSGGQAAQVEAAGDVADAAAGESDRGDATSDAEQKSTNYVIEDILEGIGLDSSISDLFN